MKNPHITNTLTQIMKSDQAQKLELIGAIINHNKENNPLFDECKAFNILYELMLSDLKEIHADCINDKWKEVLNILTKKHNNTEDDNC